MLIILVVTIMIVIALYDVPPLVHEGRWDDLKVFGMLWSAALVLGILQTSGVSLPNPTTFIVYSAHVLGETFHNFLGC